MIQCLFYDSFIFHFNRYSFFVPNTIITFVPGSFIFQIASGTEKDLDNIYEKLDILCDVHYIQLNLQPDVDDSTVKMEKRSSFICCAEAKINSELDRSVPRLLSHFVENGAGLSIP